MITAHLPSGYILARTTRRPEPLVVWACILGAVWPDFDLLFFYLVDDRAFHHHRYWVHAPGFWLMILAVVTPIALRLRSPLKQAAFWFMGGWFLHMCLDTVVGDIMWLWPYSDQMFRLATVQPTHSHFVLSFMAHWSFALEIMIWLIAAALMLARRRAA